MRTKPNSSSLTKPHLQLECIAEKEILPPESNTVPYSSSKHSLTHLLTDPPSLSQAHRSLQVNNVTLAHVTAMIMHP